MGQQQEVSVTAGFSWMLYAVWTGPSMWDLLDLGRERGLQRGCRATAGLTRASGSMPQAAVAVALRAQQHWWWLSVSRNTRCDCWKAAICQHCFCPQGMCSNMLRLIQTVCHTAALAQQLGSQGHQQNTQEASHKDALGAIAIAIIVLAVGVLAIIVLAVGVLAV